MDRSYYNRLSGPRSLFFAVVAFSGVPVGWGILPLAVERMAFDGQPQWPAGRIVSAGRPDGVCLTKDDSAESADTLGGAVCPLVLRSRLEAQWSQDHPCQGLRIVAPQHPSLLTIVPIEQTEASRLLITTACPCLECHRLRRHEQPVGDFVLCARSH